MFFSWIIGEVGFGGFPIDVELTLLAPISHPMDAHIGAFKVFGFHRFIQNTPGGGIVGFDRGGALWVPHVVKSLSEKCSFARV